MQDRNSNLIEWGKFLVATVIATASACWTARGVLADYDKRMTVIETQQDLTTKNLTDALGEIRSDLRELRTAVLGESKH